MHKGDKLKQAIENSVKNFSGQEELNIKSIKQQITTSPAVGMTQKFDKKYELDEDLSNKTKEQLEELKEKLQDENVPSVMLSTGVFAEFQLPEEKDWEVDECHNSRKK